MNQATLGKRIVTFAMAVLLCTVSVTAEAASFGLDVHGASGLGTAFAGGVAGAEDASTVWWNPAGMGHLEGRQLSVAGNQLLTYINLDVQDRGSTLSPLLGGSPIPGSDGETDEPGFVPSVYLVQPVNDRITVGLGVDAPFGLSGKYKDDWVGRYHALESTVQSINFNPNVAVKVNDYLVLAAGVDVLYFDAKLTSAIDQSAVCLGLEGGGLLPPGTCAGAGLVTPGSIATDGKAEIKADGWDLGYNLGVMLSLSEHTRVGATYRSGIDADLDGDGDFKGINPLFTSGLNLFTDTDASSNLDLPGSAAIGVYHQFNDHWAIMGDVTWTQWSALEEVRIQFDNPNQPDSVETLKYDDSFAYRLGVHYMPSSKWKFRLGGAFDESAVPNKEFASPRIPTGDRIWAAVGARYTPSQNWSLDVGYAHLFFDTLKFNRTLETPIPTANAVLKAETANESCDILGLQFNWNF